MNVENDIHTDVRRRILAGMETGNVQAARTVLVEYAEHFPKEAQAISVDVAATYGTFL